MNNQINNAFNVLNTKNLDINSMFQNKPYGSFSNQVVSTPINPMIMAFEQNRYIKDDKIIHYAVAFTSMKSSEKKEECDEKFRSIVYTKNAYCLMGFSIKRIYFQYYDNNGVLVGTFALDRTQCKTIKTSYVKDTSVILITFDNKNKIYFYLPDVIPNENGVKSFGDKDQTLIVSQILDDIKKRKIFM